MRRSVYTLPGLYVSAVDPRQRKWTKIRESGHQSGESHSQAGVTASGDAISMDAKLVPHYYPYAGHPER